MSRYTVVGLIVRDRATSTIYDVIEVQSETTEAAAFFKALRFRLEKHFLEDVTLYVREYMGHDVTMGFLFDVALAFPKGSHKAQPCVVFQGQSVPVEQFTRFTIGA